MNPMSSLFRILLIAAVVLLAVLVGFQFFGKERKPVVPVITHNMVVEQVIALGKLELVRYTFKDVVEYERGATSNSIINKILPNAKAVLIVVGEAVGCIDLAAIKPEDIVMDSATVTLTLPKAELCVYKIDHQKSKLYDLTNGYFVPKGQMVSDAYKEAETQVQKSALEMDILEQTYANADKILKPLLEKIASKKVIFRRPPADSTIKPQ
jgi:hypothetical protein